MNDIEEKRSKVMLAYKGDGWRKKVESMSDSQVLAVYKRFLKCGKIRGAYR